MTNIFLVLKLRWILAIRWARDNLFDAFVLAPLILWGIYQAVGLRLERLSTHLVRLTNEGTWQPIEAMGFLLAIKLAISWKGAMEEFQPQSSPDACLIYLPVRESERYLSICLHRGFKNCGLALLLGTLLLPFRFSHLLLSLELGLLATILEVGFGILRIDLLPRVFRPLTSWRPATRTRPGPAATLGTMFKGLLEHRLRPELRALVLRDILLTLRFFSLGVTLHYLAAVLCLAVMAIVLPQVEDDGRAVRVVTGLTTAYGVAMIALVSPRLLKFQLPYWWIERSMPISFHSIWEAKIWHANAIALWFPVLVVLIRCWVLPVSSWQACLLAAEQVLTAILVASLIGALVFETHQQPWLGVLFSGLGATAFALMMVLLHWGLFFILFPHLMHAFAERGKDRVRFLLLAHDPS